MIGAESTTQGTPKSMNMSSHMESIQEVIRDGDYERAVALLGYTHAALLDDVFETSLHILVEKPLCTRLEDCRRVEERAANHPGVVWVGMDGKKGWHRCEGMAGCLLSLLVFHCSRRLH